MIGTVRDAVIEKLEAITPSVQSGVRFLASVDDSELVDDFRTWAEANSAACLRRFDVETPGDTEEPAVSWVTDEHVTESVNIVVSYPNDNRFGGRNALLEVIDADMAAIEQYAGTRGFAVDPIAATVISEPSVREEGVGVFFGIIPLRVSYWRSAP